MAYLDDVRDGVGRALPAPPHVRVDTALDEGHRGHARSANRIVT